MARTASSSNRPPSVEPEDASSELRVVKTEPIEADPEELKEVLMADSEEMKDPLADEDPFDFPDSKEHIEKFERYEAEARQYLMEKYFSDKTIHGGNIYDVKMNIDGQTIKASRLPPYESYIDPTKFNEKINKDPSASAETKTSAVGTSKEKPPST